MAAMTMITWAMPQMTTPIQIVLNRPHLVSASHPPKIGYNLMLAK